MWIKKGRDICYDVSKGYEEYRARGSVMELKKIEVNAFCDVPACHVTEFYIKVGNKIFRSRLK